MVPCGTNNLPAVYNIFHSVQDFQPKLVVLGTVDEDVDGAVAGEEEVADRDHDAQAGNPHDCQLQILNILCIAKQIQKSVIPKMTAKSSMKLTKHLMAWQTRKTRTTVTSRKAMFTSLLL